MGAQVGWRSTADCDRTQRTRGSTVDRPLPTTHRTSSHAASTGYLSPWQAANHHLWNAVGHRRQLQHTQHRIWWQHRLPAATLAGRGCSVRVVASGQRRRSAGLQVPPRAIRSRLQGGGALLPSPPAPAAASRTITFRCRSRLTDRRLQSQITGYSMSAVTIRKLRQCSGTRRRRRCAGAWQRTREHVLAHVSTMVRHGWVQQGGVQPGRCGCVDDEWWEVVQAHGSTGCVTGGHSTCGRTGECHFFNIWRLAGGVGGHGTQACRELEKQVCV